MNPASILGGTPPRLLDEWQLAPGIWNPMRRACDARGMRGQFILTGSADPPDDITRHSGAGRIMRVRMRPMSLYESGESDGRVSLGGLLDGWTARSETRCGWKGCRWLRDKLDRAQTGDPAKLIVITAGGYAYERPDGVSVAPITALGP